MRGSLFFSILFRICLIASSVFAFNTYAKAELCISREDIIELAETYPQISSLTGSKTEHKSQYCQNDLGFNWHSLISSLVILKNTRTESLIENRSDAFTINATSENNWWAYFTKRAQSFLIERRCQQHYSAYIDPIFGEGVIHLCPPFFNQSPATQASILMHEVRHFDGHQHVDCTQGNENGIRKACDNNVSDKGSYAISLQTLVGLARSEQVSTKEKEVLEAEAMYIAFNKFNETPEVKMKASVILANSSGEVFEWNINGSSSFVGQLNAPALLLNSFNSLTIFPLNTSLEAYRMNKHLSQKKSKAGVFARVYNETDASEKGNFQNISYFGTGGLLKDNELMTFCNNKNISVDNLDEFGVIKRIISISNDVLDVERSAFLLTESGNLISYRCATQESSDLEFEEISLKIQGEAKTLVESFSLDGEQYALLENGKLVLLNLKNNVFTTKELSLPLDNKDWVSATPMSRPEVF